MNFNQIWESPAIKRYKTVDEIKTELRKANWNYMCQHPEVRRLLKTSSLKIFIIKLN